MSDLRVDVSREFVLTRMIRGVVVTKPTGWQYVDVYFPDGSQRTCGYIGKSLDGAFAPLSGMNADLSHKIQEKINEIAGHANGDGPDAPEIAEPKRSKR